MPDPTANEKPSLTAAIEQAVGDTKPPQETSETAVEDAKTETTETDEKPETKPEPEVKDLETQQALELFRALKDPGKASQVIDFLAKSAGYDKVQTKQEVKEATKDITKVLEEELGEDLQFLAPRLGKALDKYFGEKVKETSKEDSSDLRARVENMERERLQQETAVVHKQLSQEYFNADDMPENVIKELSAAMDLFPPTDPGMSIKDYYNNVFTFVRGKLNLTPTKNSSERADRNRNDAPARNLSSQNRGAVAEGNPAKKMNLTEAVADAVAKVEQQQKRK